MDDLNKTQVVLLTLFVSFVTSIATGIVTVTLLEQAPVGVTQTINRVVEHTVERVIPGESKTTIKEVLITGEDVIARIVEQSKSAFARIEVTLDPAFVEEGDPPTRVFTGVVVSPLGYILSSSEILSLPRRQILVHLASGTELKAELLTQQNTEISILKILPLAKQKLSFLSLAEKLPALGEPIVGLGYEGKATAIALGRVTRIEGATAAAAAHIFTDINHEWPVLGTSGEVLGYTRKDGRLVSSLTIQALVDQISKIKNDRSAAIVTASSTPLQEAAVGEVLPSVQSFPDTKPVQQ